MKMRTLADWVLVKTDTPEELSNLIWMPDREKDLPQTGTVVSVGNGTRHVEMQVEVGQRVFFSRYKSVIIQDEDEGEQAFVRMGDIWAVIDEGG